MLIVPSLPMWLNWAVAHSPVKPCLIGAIEPAAICNLLFWVAVFVVLVFAAVYVLSKIRARTVQQEPLASEMMSKFRELHSRGGLSDAEFRTIKTTLTARLQQELKDNEQKG
jgi:uncharacterized membrane protein